VSEQSQGPGNHGCQLLPGQCNRPVHQQCSAISSAGAHPQQSRMHSGMTIISQVELTSAIRHLRWHAPHS
jgi:hypothetical protein